MKKIGLDISLACCRAEGYMTMSYEPKEFKKDPRNTDCNFQRTLTDYDREYLGWQFNGYDTVILDQCYSYAELYEIYLEYKEDDCDVHREEENPTPMDVLQLGDTVNNLGYMDTRGVTLNQLKLINEKKEEEWKKKKAQRP